jgi:hypothetical protein
MKSTAGALPDLQPPRAPQLLCFHKLHDADYGFIEHELADLSHEWWFSATGTLYVRLDTCLFRIAVKFAL